MFLTLDPTKVQGKGRIGDLRKPGSRDLDHRRVQQEQRYARAGQQPYRKKKKESWLIEIFD